MTLQLVCVTASGTVLLMNGHIVLLLSSSWYDAALGAAVMQLQCLLILQRHGKRFTAEKTKNPPINTTEALVFLRVSKREQIRDFRHSVGLILKVRRVSRLQLNLI